MGNSYGGTRNDYTQSVIEVSDGYVFAGYTSSDDGDVSSNSGSLDCWIVKLDFDGQIVWEHTYGGTGTDAIFDVIETLDGGLVMLGTSNSDEVTWPYFETFGVLLIKTSADGQLEWSNNYETEFGGYGFHIIQDDIGDFVIGGIVFVPTASDFFQMKLTSTGDKLWQQTYLGGASVEFLSYFNESNDGYILGATIDGDAWIMQTDTEGVETWQRYIGAAGIEGINDIAFTEEGHILGLGFTTSEVNGANSNENNILMVELDSNGQLVWQEIFNDEPYEAASEIESTHDGAYLITVESLNLANGNSEMSVIKLLPRATATLELDPHATPQLYPNPASDKINIKVSNKDIGSSYTVCNSIGQEVLIGEVKDVEATINIKNLPPGHYAFKLMTEKGEGISFVKY